MSTLTDTPPSTAQVLDWLRDLEPAPYTPPYVSLEDDMENGHLYLSTYAHGVALVFHGGYDFIDRWFNWAVNCGVIGRGAQLNWLYEQGTGRVAYVCPRSREAVRKGLAAQFETEILRAREIPVTCRRDVETEEVDCTWDENAVAVLADARAEAFIRRHMPVNHLILERARNIAPVYEVTGPGLAEQRWAGTGTEG